MNFLLGIKVRAMGDAGHGSTLLQNTANEKLLDVLAEFSAWRREEFAKLAKLDGNLGKVCTINITMLKVNMLH